MMTEILRAGLEEHFQAFAAHLRADLRQILPHGAADLDQQVDVSPGRELLAVLRIRERHRELVAVGGPCHRVALAPM